MLTMVSPRYKSKLFQPRYFFLSNLSISLHTILYFYKSKNLCLPVKCSLIRKLCLLLGTFSNSISVSSLFISLTNF